MTQYIPKIISAAVGLALLGVGARLLVAGHADEGAGLLAASLAMLGAVGTMALPSLAPTRKKPDPKRDAIVQQLLDERDRGTVPPSDGALALALCVVAAACAVAVSGCGPTELQVHAQVARGLDDVARESGHVVRTWRTQRQRAAALAVHDAGGSEQEAIAAARTAGDEAQPVVQAQRLFALGVHGYTLAALQHAAGDVDLSRFARAIRTMVDAYRSLRLLGVELHIEAIAAWPELPTILDTLLPPQLLAAASASATDGGAR